MESKVTKDIVSESEMNCNLAVHHKKFIKHALRQQIKRRRKNTTIAAGNTKSFSKLTNELTFAMPEIAQPTFINQENNIGIEKFQFSD